LKPGVTGHGRYRGDSSIEGVWFREVLLYFRDIT